jgi:DNA-binding XRE family transcriptional regulator
MPTGSLLRARRLAAGLSQERLARHADVSRALVASVEGGRHTPAVGAALRLAAALDATVEELFGPAVAEPAPVTAVLGGEAPPDGAGVRAARVGGRTVVAPAREGLAGWAPADGVLAGGALRPFPGIAGEALVVAGCDPALGLAEALLGPRRLLAVQATTGDALAALRAARCHAAAVHGPAGALPAAPRGAHRERLARWRVGLASHPALGRPTLEALAGGDVALVSREPSATSQQALARAAARLGAGEPPPAGPVAAGHLEAARRALWGRCAAVTMEPAARALGLDFEPLEAHVVELWLAPGAIDHPGATALLELLASAAFRARLQALDYDMEADRRDAA